MKFLSLTTIFTLLFFSGAVVGQEHENGEQRNQTAAQERQIDGTDHQRLLYSQDQYDSRYDEGVKRGKQAREEELNEERKKEKKEQKKDEHMKKD